MGELNQLLTQAASRGETSRVNDLLTQGAQINTQDAQGRTALMAATYGNHAETVKALLDAGADVNLRDTMHNPFLYAGAEGYLDILKLAWAAGADTKLEAIILCDGGPRHQQIVALLLDHGADVTLADKDGVTPLAHAQQRGYAEIERRLRAASATE